MAGLVILVLVLSFLGWTYSREIYTFGDCSRPLNNVFKTYGGRVKSQQTRLYKGDDLNCTFIFRAAEPDMTFHIVLVDVNIPRIFSGCADSLTIKAYNKDLTNSTMVLDKFCGIQSNEELKTNGHYLEITWVGSNNTKFHTGFNLVITAVKTSPVQCNKGKYFECEKGSCISSTLFCDGTYNCFNKKDEFGCYTTAELIGRKGNRGDRSRDSSQLTTTEEPDEFDADEWEEGMDSVSVMIVVGVILLIVLGCFIVGCRKREAAENLVQRTLLRSWSSEARSPRNYGDGRRGTPPPSYSFIERQTSYVSDISISSSQLSFPPEYDEAVDMPEQPDSSNSSSSQGQQPRRTRFLSRHGSSRRAPRPRVHRVGTFSPGDINARRGSRLQRSMSDGERPQQTSSIRGLNNPQRTSTGGSGTRGANVPVPPLRFRIESTTSSIFEEVFEDNMSHLSPVGSAILEEDDVIFSEDGPSHANNSNGNNLQVTPRSRDHRGDDSDTALLDDEDDDDGDTDASPALPAKNVAPTH